MFDLQNLVLIFSEPAKRSTKLSFHTNFGRSLGKVRRPEKLDDFFRKFGVLEIWKKRKVFTHRCVNIIYISTRLQHLATFEPFIIFHDFGARPLSDLRIIQAIRCWCPQHHFHQSCCCLWRYKWWCFNFNELFNSTTVMQLICLTSYCIVYINIYIYMIISIHNIISYHTISIPE